MSKKISYKGQVPVGEQDRIKLATINGKTGYKINKFDIIGQKPGVGNSEYVGQIFLTDQSGSVTNFVDFTNGDLLAVAYHKEGSGTAEGFESKVIFDNEKFNQDIFVNITDASGGTTPCNYYIELETMSLSDLESTMLTLKSLRTILD
tara:strand:+ start:156 stop:599 length:444 start_codon:yes stop_codon:yes gene_type:complete